MLKQASSPIGMDVPIQKIQTVLHERLLEVWELESEDYTAFDRARRNRKDGGYVAEVYSGANQYREVYFNDQAKVVSFIGIGEQIDLSAPLARTDMHIVFFVNLAEVKPENVNSPDEEVRRDVLQAIGRTMHGFTVESIDLGLENVLREYPGSRRDKNLAKLDMHPMHCFRISGTLTYNPKLRCSVVSSGSNEETISSATDDGPGYGSLDAENGTLATPEVSAPFYQLNLTSVGDSVVSIWNTHRAIVDWGDGSPLMSYPNAVITKTYSGQTSCALKVYYKTGSEGRIHLQQGGPSFNLPATAIVSSITGTTPPGISTFKVGDGLPSLPADLGYATLSTVDVGSASLSIAEIDALIQALVDGERESETGGLSLKLLGQDPEALPTNLSGITTLISRGWTVQGYS